MADWNEVLDAGDVDGGVINVVVEIPKGSNNKIEWKRNKKVFMIDRVDPKIFAKPVNYGFIPQTLDEDGDELDTLILGDELPTGVYLEARVLGVMKFIDGGEVDDKVIVVPADDRETGDAIKTLADVPDRTIREIEFHFNHYKDLKKAGDTKVVEFADLGEAKRIIKLAQKRWSNQ